MPSFPYGAGLASIPPRACARNELPRSPFPCARRTVSRSRAAPSPDSSDTVPPHQFTPYVPGESVAVSRAFAKTKYFLPTRKSNPRQSTPCWRERRGRTARQAIRWTSFHAASGFHVNRRTPPLLLDAAGDPQADDHNHRLVGAPFEFRRIVGIALRKHVIRNPLEVLFQPPFVRGPARSRPRRFDRSRRVPYRYV